MPASEDHYPGGAGFMDGEYCAREALRIPVADLGFTLGDMCYDAIHVRNGCFFRLDDHLDRFERSVARRRFTTLPYGREAIRSVLMECVRRAGLRDSLVTLVATRGEAAGFTKDLRTCQNRLLAWSAPYFAIVSDEQLARGTSIVTSSVRRIPPDSVDPTVKNFGRLDFCDALLEAYGRGHEHAILLDEAGRVTEGRGWNIFALHDGTLVSPDRGVLEGVTRRTIFELCERTNLDAGLGEITGPELKAADELFMTSTAGGIIPITRVDDTVIGGGAPGPVTARLTDLYWALHDEPAYRTPVEYD